MMQLTLSGGEITDIAELHRVIAAQLGFPEWYGGNLDALYDCLTDVSKPTEITVKNSGALTASLGGYASAFEEVLRQSARENENISLNIE